MSRWSTKSRSIGATADVRSSVAAPARRPRRARILDPRLWLGIVLVAVSVTAGVRIMNSQDDGVVVLQATRDLDAGSTLVALAPVRVSRSVAGDQYLIDLPPQGAVLRWPVMAGELVPASAITVGTVVQLREVSVPVDPLHAPPGLESGDLVDLWSSPREAEEGQPVLVLAGLSVAEVATDDVGMGGEIGVVLLVPSEQVTEVVAAARAGVVDLVAVPTGSQVVAEGR